jgi:ferric-dicitrate binding protein FerR (iron transport regulator)
VTAPRTATVLGEELRAAYELAELRRQEAAERERRAYEAWQDAYGAHEVARDEARAAHRAYRTCSTLRAGVPA